MPTLTESQTRRVNAMKRFSLDLTLEGADVSPETVDVVDLLRIVEPYREAVVVTARHMGCELDQKLPVICLVGIRRKCAQLKISAPLAAKRPIQEVSRALAFDDWKRCGPEVRGHLRDAARKLAERNWTFQLPSYRTRLPILTGDFGILPVQKQSVRGETTLFGTIQTAGGKHPHLDLVLENGQSVRVNGSQDDIKALGKRLYDEVGLQGVAQWDAVTGQIESLELHGINDFEPTDLTTAFKELAAVAGRNWDNINAVEFVSHLRN